jgi:hypothetical protein
VVVRSGDTVTVTGSAQAAHLTVDGVLRASRTASSTLTLNGNVVVQGQGWLDYGTRASPLPQSITARIRFFLNEAQYRGGVTLTPLDSDVGVWAIGRGRVTTAGPDRGAWTLLRTSAPAGSNQIVVDTTHVTRWYVGDELVIGPSNQIQSGGSPNEDERRVIVADLGGGRYQLDRPLSYAHNVQPVAWTDPAGDAWADTLAPPVGNLSRNVVFEAADLNHRPHFLITNEATTQLEDLAIIGFSPIPRNIGTFGDPRRPIPIPFGRYALHFHMQTDASRGSAVRQVVIRDGMGNGMHIHQAFGVVVEDLIVYNQARAFVNGVPGTRSIFLEEVRDSRGSRVADTGANDAWIDRALVGRLGAGLGDTSRPTAMWMGGGVGAYIVGFHAFGARGGGSGIHWCEGCGNPASANPGNGDRAPRVLRATAHSSVTGFFWWQNSTPTQDVVDLLAWNNRSGVDMGAYQTDYTVHHARAIGNYSMNFTDHAVGASFVNFLIDGQNRSQSGVFIQPYQFATAVDTRYESGVIRNVSNAVTYHPCLQQQQCGSNLTHVQLNRVQFDAASILRYDWHANSGSTIRVRGQSGLAGGQPANFTLYRPDRRDISGGAYDSVSDAIRVNNDTQNTLPATPRVKMVYGASYGGCTADDATSAGAVTLCVETTADDVEFYVGARLIARQDNVRGFAQVSFDMRSWPHRRGYFYAKGIGANGEIGYTRVLRVRKP